MGLPEEEEPPLPMQDLRPTTEKEQHVQRVETSEITPPSTMDDELAQLTAELNAARRRAQIRLLKAELEQLQAREANPELDAAFLAPTSLSAPTRASIGSGVAEHHLLNLSLPRPEPPPRYEGRSRKELNAWIRGCEEYIESSSQLATPAAQVAFAKRYLGQGQSDYWDREVRALPEGTRTESVRWPFMKEVMLKTLGSPWEREQLARKKVRDARQGGHSPTELLNYLKTQWEEIDSATALDDKNQQHIHEYYSALDPKIKERLELTPQRWESLIELESVVNQHWRIVKNRVGSRLGRRGPDDHEDRDTNPRPQKKSNTNAPKGHKGADNVYRDRKDKTQAKLAQTLKDRANDACYYCHQSGHIKKDCPSKPQDLSENDLP